MSFFFPKPPIYTGLNGNRLASIRKSQKGWEIISLKKLSGDENFKKDILVSTIPSKQTLVRSFAIPIRKEKNLKAALNFQIEPHLPYSAEKAIIQAVPVEKTAQGTVVTAFSVKKDHLQEHLDHLGNLEPEHITCAPAALAALSTLFPKIQTPCLVVHEGDFEVICALVEDGKLLAVHSFEASQNLEIEIQKTVLSFQASHKNKYFETIFFLPKNSATEIKIAHKTVTIPSTPLVSEEDLLNFGLSIGSAMSATTIDFRQKSFAYPHKWRRIKKPLFTSAILATLLIGIFFGFTTLSLQKQKKDIQTAYASLLTSEGKKVDFPETDFDYLRSLQKLEKEVRSRPNIHPLLPSIPKVKELLAWIGAQGSLEIEAISYTMIKRPQFSEKKERYQVKVELECSATNPSAFHDALMDKNGIVDLSEEVKWRIDKGKCFALFYLKDKTRYL